MTATTITCPRCGGTQLPNGYAHTPRGTCHCPRARAVLTVAEAVADCPEYQQNADAFLEDPITEAYGVGAEMLPLIARGHVRGCRRCTIATTVGVPQHATRQEIRK